MRLPLEGKPVRSTNGHSSRIALVIEYDGTEFHGFQYQANAPTIQEELEKAIARLAGERRRVRGAGRTDAGVHATGQVVAFDTAAAHPPDTFVRALNFYLPEGIAVKVAHRVRGDFDPRRMALSRRYRYTIDCSPTPSPLLRRTTYHLGELPNVRRMRAAARSIVGEHDFGMFVGPLAKPEASTVREIHEAMLYRKGDIVTFEVEANSFLHQQVRRLAGGLVAVGRGRLALDAFRSMVYDTPPEGPPVEKVVRALPPQGLCLLKVSYADFPPEVGESHDDKH